jgi:hypothetical protein
VGGFFCSKKVTSQEKAEAKAAAAALKELQKVTKTKSKLVDGGQVWQRDERLTIRVGPLLPPWEKKLDPKSGRFYFKNHETRETTWVDPRSKFVRTTVRGCLLLCWFVC